MDCHAVSKDPEKVEKCLTGIIYVNKVSLHFKLEVNTLRLTGKKCVNKVSLHFKLEVNTLRFRSVSTDKNIKD
jgi:hypothetical protein